MSSETATRPSSGPGPASDGHVRAVAVLVAIGGVLLLGIAAVAMITGDETPAAAEQTGQVDPPWKGEPLSEPLPRPDFTLTDTDGRPYDFIAETEGRLTLLFFGYTYCPDICPVHMPILTSALDQPGAPRPLVVFVSVDPDRDTPERVRSWLDQWDSDYVGLTGTPEEVAAAEEAAGLLPSFKADEDGNLVSRGQDYLVEHASQIIAFTPDDLAHVVYPGGVRSRDWLDDLPRLLETFPAEDQG